MSNMLQVILFVILSYTVLGKDCHSDYKDQKSCDSDNACTWCAAAAVPSGCYSHDDAKKLPPGVFVCDGSKKEEETLLDFTLNTIDKEITLGATSFDLNSTNLEGDQHLCDPDVGQVAGYFKLGSQNKEYFFWFFESRRNPTEDPVILWMTGGPGCSSGIALFVENGPCHVNEDGSGTTINEFSWNSKANIIYIDQPAGTGFSKGTHDHNEVGVGNDMYQFLTEFFAKFPQYNSNKFFVFGESYGGHYVPATSHRIWLGNKNLTPDSKVPRINLSGVAVGNGLTDPEIQYEYYADMAYNSGTAPSRIGKAAYTFMKYVSTPACIASIKQCNKKDGADHTTACTGSQTLCTMGLIEPYVLSGYNNYDMRQKCEKPPLCYDFSNVEKFLNNPNVQKVLGVNKRWESCSKDVTIGMLGDYMKNYQDQLPALLKDGIPVLIYAGDQDYICNWIGNKAWALALEWEGKEGFHAAPDRDWEVDGKPAGKIRSYNGFTFLQVYQAGHMVPMDQPENALEMVFRFTL